MVCPGKEELASVVKEWKMRGDRIVFTNGVFDILHIGHVTYLREARGLGDKLVVGINSDASVRRLGKGPERPINHEDDRAGVMDALACVDAVVIFDEDTPLEVIRAIEPNILVKGGDYDPDETDPAHKCFMVGAREVREWGGRALAIPLVSGYSTTGLVEKLRKPGRD